jgi:Methyltransferase domain
VTTVVDLLNDKGEKKNEGGENHHHLKMVLLANSNRKIAERRAWLSDKHSEGSEFAALKSDLLYYMFSPVLPCFWTFEKQPSSAEVHDGGKWLCGLEEVHKMRSASSGMTRYGIGESRHYDDFPCIVYSMGSNNEFSFERRVRTIAPGCEIHTFDPTVKETGDGVDAYDVYHGDFGFGGKDDAEGGTFPVKSIATIMKEMKHTHVDYLKADVEGYEWEFLSTVDWSITKVGQILIEIHPQLGRGGVEPTAKDIDAVFTKLEEAGYRLISLEPVTISNFGQVELVFLHKDWEPSVKW